MLKHDTREMEIYIFHMNKIARFILCVDGITARRIHSPILQKSRVVEKIEWKQWEGDSKLKCDTLELL